MTSTSQRSRPARSSVLSIARQQVSASREMCYRCFRAAKVCICANVPRVANRTGVIVLQHHREQLHPIGTTRIAHLGLQQVSVVIARRQALLQCHVDLPPKTGLLYPGANATNLQDLDSQDYPDNLVAIDGTWFQAKQLVRANAWLQHLPRYSLKPNVPSQYRIRRQPQLQCLSTIEAIVHALKLIEPETEGLEKLLDVFHLMVDRQIECRKRSLLQK